MLKISPPPVFCYISSGFTFLLCASNFSVQKREEGGMVKHGRGLRYNLSLTAISYMSQSTYPAFLGPKAYNVNNIQLHIHCKNNDRSCV